MTNLTIAVLAGTTRAQRQSIYAARFVAEVGRSYPELEVIFVDPGDFSFPGDGNDPEGKDPRYTAIVGRADGFFIVSPEYNHGYPGSLKRMLDSELALYVHKAVAFAGVSSGHWGGLRMVEQLVGVVRELGLVATYTDSYFPNVQDLFEADGILKADQRERYTKAVRASFDELIWMSRALKVARDGR